MPIILRPTTAILEKPTLSTAHCVHYTLHTAHCVHCTLHTAHCTKHTTHHTLHLENFPLHIMLNPDMVEQTRVNTCGGVWGAGQRRHPFYHPMTIICLPPQVLGWSTSLLIQKASVLCTTQMTLICHQSNW